MPLGDSRTYFSGSATPKPKRALGTRTKPKVDTDALLTELRDISVQTVARVLGVGGAIQFGSTRDRTAMLIRVWAGGDTYEDYVSSVGEYMATLEVIDDVLQGLESKTPRD